MINKSSCIRYCFPEGVKPNELGSRLLLSTIQGGMIAVEPILLALWQQADGHTLEDILRDFSRPSGKSKLDFTSETIQAALACLAEAGLLTRKEVDISHLNHRAAAVNNERKPVVDQVTASLVSVIIVDYNSQEWLVECLPSLQAQTHQSLEILVIDNGSRESSLSWLAQNYPAVKSYRLEPTASLATAINHGIQQAQGKYFLILNPDVTLEPDAITQLVSVAENDPVCAAVAAKLKYWWAPAFLNGLGNRVGASKFGSDNAQGHLDLGQFDDWDQVPSACFAATLIPRSAWEAVGSLDEAFPLYYEDVDWSYRARLLGRNIRVAPKAVIYHAFGHRVHTGVESDLTPYKLRCVVYGRLRFAVKLLASPTLWRFLFDYGIEDKVHLLLRLLKFQGHMAGAILSGWLNFLKNLSSIISQRHRLQLTRRCTDNDLFVLQGSIPPGLIWHGLPELTWEIITHTYLPLILSGKTRPLIEFSYDPML